MKRFYVFLFLFFAAAGFSQTPGVIWHSCVGDAQHQQPVSNMLHLADGGIVIAGKATSSDDPLLRSYIQKNDADGNLVWSKYIYADLGIFHPLSDFSKIAATSDGGIMCVGTCDMPFPGSNAYFVTKLDGNGNTVWQKAFRGYNGIGQAVIKTFDNSFIVAGSMAPGYYDYPTGFGLEDIVLIKINESGDVVWQTAIGGEDVERVNDIIEMPNQDIVVAGYTFSQTGDFSSTNSAGSIALARLDSSGNLLWTKTFSGNATVAYDHPTGVIPIGGGNIAMTCIGHSTNGFFEGSSATTYSRSAIVILDGDGDPISSRVFESDGNLGFQSISNASNGNFIVSGYITSTNSSFGSTQNIDGFVGEFSSSGDLIWSKNVGGSATDALYSAIESGDGSYYASGYTFSIDGDCTGNNGLSDAWLIKFTNLLTNEANVKKGTLIYPNPVTDVLHFFQPVPPEDGIEIFDVFGKSVLRQQGGDQVDIRALRAGVYFLKIGDGLAQRNFKFLKK